MSVKYKPGNINLISKCYNPKILKKLDVDNVNPYHVLKKNLKNRPFFMNSSKYLTNELF